jgi:hypothetical protein
MIAQAAVNSWSELLIGFQGLMPIGSEGYQSRIGSRIT